MGKGCVNQLLKDAHAAYVNLDKRPDRRSRMELSLRVAGINAVRKRGLLPEEVKVDPSRIKAMLDRPQKGAIGCHFSQVSIMEDSLALGKHALVMEDDLVFCADFQKRIAYLDYFSRTNPWDVFWLGATFHVGPPYWHVNDERGCRPMLQDARWMGVDWPRMVRTFGCFCTYAYLVNKNSIAKILNMIDQKLPLSIGIDHMFIMLQPDLLCYSFVPGMVKQYDHISDIGVGKHGPAMTVFSNFARLNGSLENSAYWWQNLVEDFDPEEFDWKEAK